VVPLALADEPALWGNMAFVTGPKAVTEEIGIGYFVRRRCWLRVAQASSVPAAKCAIFQDVGLRIDRDLSMQRKFLPGRIAATCTFSSPFPRASEPDP